MSISTTQETHLRFGNIGQRILVTGATGFIGQLLVRELLAGGHDVIVLSRRPRAAAFLFSGKIKCITAIDELPVNFPLNAIINLAGARILGWRWSEARKKVLLSSRVNLTQKIVAWISAAHIKPSLLLSASAIGYYGIQAQTDHTALTEASAPQDIFMSQLCLQWENAAISAAQYGVTVKIMRFGLVLGHQGALPMMLLPIKLAMGGRLGSGKQWLSWIHVRDVLRGMEHIFLSNQRSQDKAGQVSIYNFTAPDVVTQLEFNQIAARILNRPCIMPTPAFPIRMLLGEQADLLLEGQKVVPEQLQKENFTFEFPTIISALQNLCISHRNVS